MRLAIGRELSVDKPPELDALFREIEKEFKGEADELIPLLQRAQRKLGFLPEQALLEISRFTGLSAAGVFGTATFYTQFRFQPVGKYIIRVCRGTACHVKGSNRLLDTIEEYLQVPPGAMTPDGLFTIETVACFGSCALAPIMVINDSVYGSVTRSGALKLLDDIRAREERFIGQADKRESEVEHGFHVVGGTGQ
ncbi:MAG: NAD(P)H-dependent oxidoreductase subunit E [Deltaproteobacteria bacterium]|nr:NAD(P)H-dependent oxidoreductase subunit E [Deltaproteobacteria bacterium]